MASRLWSKSYVFSTAARSLPAAISAANLRTSSPLPCARKEGGVWEGVNGRVWMEGAKR